MKSKSCRIMNKEKRKRTTRYYEKLNKNYLKSNDVF